MEAPRPLSGPRHHRGARHLTRGLCLGALILAVSAVAASGAAADTGVVFVLPNGEARPVAGAKLTPEATRETAPSEPCVVRGEAGEDPEPTQHGGLPVEQALALAEIESFGFLTLARPNGTVAYLPSEWFSGEGFEGCRYARFSVESGVTKFFRPPRGPDDANAEDNIVSGAELPLLVGVHEGRVVEVRVTASTASTTAGNPVRFEASVPAGGEFGFVWTFGDGSTATGPSIEHAFAGEGAYLVRATATGVNGDESGGESAPFELVVGSPPTTDAPGATTTPQPDGATPTGSPGQGREDRGGNGAKPAPAGGHPKSKAPKPSRPKDRPTAQRGASPEKRAKPRPEGALPPPTTSPSPLRAPEELPEGGPTEEGTQDSAEAPSPESPGRPRSTSTGPEEELVEGRLVGADLGPTSVAERVEGGDAGEGSRSAAGALAQGGSGAPVPALIVGALFAGGALLEWRRSRPTR